MVRAIDSVVRDENAGSTAEQRADPPYLDEIRAKRQQRASVTQTSAWTGGQHGIQYSPTAGSAAPQPIFLNKSLSLAVLALVQLAMPAIVAAGMLYAVSASMGVGFSDYSLALAIFVAALAPFLLRLKPAAGAAIRTSSVIRQAGSLFFRWLAMLGIVAAAGYVTSFHGEFSRDVMIGWAVATPFALLGTHLLCDYCFRRVVQSQELVRSAVIAGFNPPGANLAHRLANHPELGFELQGFFDDRGTERLGPMGEHELLGKLADVSDYVRENNVDVIFIALPMRHVQRVMEMLDELRDSTVSIYYVPDLFVCDLIQSRTGDIMGVPVVSMCETPFFGYRGVMKRVTDVVLALGVLIPALPLMGIIAAAIKLTSRGPAIFKQYRYGLDGREIRVYKFRSMYVTENGERIAQATRDDPRVTPIGRFLRKTSLDELPQIFNVLQGRMSLVGPRPHAVAHNEEYRGQIKGYMIRHKVLPGITGLAQVNGCRGETSDLSEMEARVHYDLEYLKNWSPLLDIKILFLTGIRVLQDSKAY